MEGSSTKREALFARAMLRARTSRGLTQEALAAACGVDPSQIARRESGAAAVLESSLANTAQGLGISVRQLLLEEVAPGLVEKATFDVGERHVLALVVKNVRLGTGLSQTAFAERVRLHQTAITRLEGGSSSVNEASLEGLATALRIKVETLVLRGLTYEAPPVDLIDQAAVRKRYEGAVKGGAVRPSRLAEKLGVHRSRLTRFAHGDPVSDEVARNIAAELDRLEGHGIGKDEFEDDEDAAADSAA